MADIVLDRIYNVQDLKVNFSESEPCFCANDIFLDPFEFEKKRVSKYSRRIDIDHDRFGVCEKEYWYFDCLDLYIELLILLNCKFIGTCRTHTFLLKWIINILIEKWDTVRFVDLDNALFWLIQ